MFHQSAGTTDDMVVVFGAACRELVMCVLVFHVYAPHKSGVREGFQASVGGRLVCAGADPSDQLGGRDRAVRACKETQEFHPRFGRPEAVTAQQCRKSIGRFHWYSR
jgi:hypothetical protein